MRAIILGCGNVGSSAARKLALQRPEMDFLVADHHLEAAEALAGAIGVRARAVQADVTRRESLASHLTA